MIGTRKANRLIHATSPYLQQHAYNPVDWFEWSEEALERAVRENKPILVSIGYSSCHWCHVMEREVFEKDDIANVMNETLVCIKVDREERPDIDQIYMDAVQAMGMQGGWPLNVFLTPDQKPFYGGTYFPPEQWLQVIRGVSHAFATRREEVESSAGELANHLANQGIGKLQQEPLSRALREALDESYGKLQPSFDTAWGGLAKAPKFVMPSLWRWLLRFYRLSGEQDALRHSVFTLKKIAMGGIFDHIGGGFARYSVDQYWFVPHFEKMLYDNAQLMTLYSEAYAITQDPEFKAVVVETFEWLQGEMMNSSGGFYSALDADSEGEEGKFYIWSKPELDTILSDDAALLNDYYSVREEGNWEPGKNVLIRVQPEEDFLKKHSLTPEAWNERLRKLKDKLLAERDKRVRPGLDDKVITSWNAMTVIGLVDAYRALGDERFLEAALKNMRFLENELMEGLTLFRSFKEKRSHVKAFLDDYAYVIQACTNLYQVTFDEYWIHRAQAFLQHTIEHFYDSEDGYFQYTSRDAEKLIASRKEIFDNVIPASNSVMAQNLFHMGTMFDDESWKSMAQKMVFPMEHLIISEPNYMSNWGIVYAEMKHGIAEVAFVGTGAARAGREFFAGYQPFALAMGGEMSGTLPLLDGKTAIDDRLTIYVCYNKTCQRPVHTVTEALDQLLK